MNFSPKIDFFLRLFSIWLAGTAIGMLVLSQLTPLNKQIVLFLAAVPSTFLAWVCAKHAMKVFKETNKEWVRHAASAQTMCAISCIVVASTIFVQQSIS